jgi:hypothetical protein
VAAQPVDRIHVQQLLAASEKLLLLQRQIVSGMALIHLPTDTAEKVMHELERDVEGLRQLLEESP